MTRQSIAEILKASPAVLAPMAGITDRTYRQLAREQGAVLTYTEMISAKALSYDNKKTREMLDITGEAWPVAVQLFGSEAEIMAEAALKAEAAGAAFVDVNMGCPVPKVVKNHEGSALLENPQLAADIVAAMSKVCHIPISVKIRLGVDATRLIAVDFALRMQEAGASLIAVHGRTRDQYYSGKADWRQIGLVKEALDIPVIGNGDVRLPRDAAAMMAQTDCDAVMIGRAMQGNPWLVGRTIDCLREGNEYVPPTMQERITMALEHSQRLISLKGETKAIPELRKHLAWYLKGLPNTASLKVKLFHAAKLDEVQDLLYDYLNESQPNRS